MSELSKTIIVRCTFDLPVEVPESDDYDEIFDIEENHCPGTGRVGAVIDALIKEHDENHTCWACAVQGKCEII